MRPIAFINPKLSTQNVGDFFIEDSVKRIVDHDPQQSVDVDPRYPLGAEQFDQINRCDLAIIVGTNLWYRHVLKERRWCLTVDDLKRIVVPVIPFGVGTTRHRGEDNEFEPESLEILRALHDKCQLASVRDLRTAEALNEAGIQNVRMTGCPTLFRTLKPTWCLKRREETRHVTVTVRKGQRKNVRALLRLLRAREWEPTIAAQQEKDNYFRTWLPFLQKPTPTIYEYNIAPYLERIETSVGAIGWRLHGNMLHLAYGNPAVFFANCSRAQSFCDAFHLPCITAEDGDVIAETDLSRAIEQLVDPATFDEFSSRYEFFFREMVDFLETNRVAHHLSHAHQKVSK